MRAVRPWQSLLLLFCLMAALLPMPAQADSGTRVDVSIPSEGPWVGHIIGLDPHKVLSVTYYIRDAASHWRHTDPVTFAPFDAQLDWWFGDNSSYEAVTAHVLLRDGKRLNDPGGWHWVDGRHTNPGGKLAAVANPDGSVGAAYTAAAHLSDINGVEVFFRDRMNLWSDAGSASLQTDGSWRLAIVPKTTAPGGWRGDGTALSVHVRWVSGGEVVDPTSWVTTFPAGPVARVPIPPPAATAPQVPAAPAPPPQAAPYQPPQAGCYPLSNHGGCYQPGEFCRTSDHGVYGVSGSGRRIVCMNNNGWRWEPV